MTHATFAKGKQQVPSSATDGWGHNSAQTSQQSPILKNNNQANATTQTTQQISILWSQCKLSGPLNHREQAGNHRATTGLTPKPCGSCCTTLPPVFPTVTMHHQPVKDLVLLLVAPLGLSILNSGAGHWESVLAKWDFPVVRVSYFPP